MSNISLGIIGGGQLGSMLTVAAKKFDIKVVVYCDDKDGPAQDFCDEYIHACLLYTSPSPRDISGSRMPSSA